MRRLPWLAAGVALAACASGGGPGSNVEWRQTVDLRMNQSAMVDGGGLELTLTSVGVNEITLVIDARETPREARLRTGMAGARTYYPYRVTLRSTSIANTATVEVARLR